MPPLEVTANAPLWWAHPDSNREPKDYEENHRSTKHAIPGQYIFNSIQYRLIQAISQRFAHNLPMANVTRLDIVALLG